MNKKPQPIKQKSGHKKANLTHLFSPLSLGPGSSLVSCTTTLGIIVWEWWVSITPTFMVKFVLPWQLRKTDFKKNQVISQLAEVTGIFLSERWILYILASPKTNNCISNFLSPMTFPADRKGHCGCFGVLNDQATPTKKNILNIFVLEETLI